MHNDAYSHAVVKELSIGILHRLPPLWLVRHRKVDRQRYASSCCRDMASTNKATLLVRCVQCKRTSADITAPRPSIDRLIKYTNCTTIFMEGKVAPYQARTVC